MRYNPDWLSHFDRVSVKLMDSIMSIEQKARLQAINESPRTCEGGATSIDKSKNLSWTKYNRQRGQTITEACGKADGCRAGGPYTSRKGIPLGIKIALLSVDHHHRIKVHQSFERAMSSIQCG